jgi:hypothetical protein
MPVHSCGNPLHDVPQWALFAAPFLAPVILWVRVKVSSFLARKA